MEDFFWFKQINYRHCRRCCEGVKYFKELYACNNFEPICPPIEFYLIFCFIHESKCMWIDVYSNNFSRTSFDFSFVDKDSMKSKAIASNAWFIAYLYRLKIIEWEKTESACKFSLSSSYHPHSRSLASLYDDIIIDLKASFFDPQRNFFSSLFCAWKFLWMNSLSLDGGSSYMGNLLFHIYIFYTQYLCSKIEWVRYGGKWKEKEIKKQTRSDWFATIMFTFFFTVGGPEVTAN